MDIIISQSSARWKGIGDHLVSLVDMFAGSVYIILYISIGLVILSILFVLFYHLLDEYSNFQKGSISYKLFNISFYIFAFLLGPLIFVLLIRSLDFVGAIISSAVYLGGLWVLGKIDKHKQEDL